MSDGEILINSLLVLSNVRFLNKDSCT